MRVAGLLALLMTAAVAHAQAYLDCHFAPGWEQDGTKRQYAADNLYDYKDGGAEGYLIFGFVRMRGITCKSGGDTLDIDASEMSDADAAYGMFTANLDPSVAIAKIGMGGQVQRQSASFAKGNYYVELVMTSADPNSDQSALMNVFAAGMLKSLDGRDSAPEAVEWFPKETLVSVRMVPESVLGLRQLKRGFVAKYKQGQAFLVQEASSESAAEVLKSLRGRFDGALPVQIGDEGFQSKAPYLDGICVFRKGRFLGGYANLPNAQQAASLASTLAARIP
ncbi:MAG TPA: DUF6599 family protein [Terracidiphilus sp.]|nr:DUF6599 family protein [Terracidiphilus sp.]